MNRRDLIIMLGGAAVSWPLGVRSQPASMPFIGSIGLTSANAIERRLVAFRAGLKEAGFVEGESVTIEYRYAGGQFDRASALVAELLERHVDVIVTAGSTPLPRAAMAATKTVPIVFTNGGDPVADGLVASLARPGGNATGATFYSGLLLAKQLELLRELVPSMKVIAVTNPPVGTSDEQKRLLREAARSGEEIVPITVSAVSELEGVFATILQHRADAAIMADPISNQQIERLVAFTTQNRLPVISGLREITAAGCLMSYGSSIDDTYRQVGVYAGRILKGAKPADLPVVQPTRFELVINLTTAKALGLPIPPTLLARADE